MGARAMIFAPASNILHDGAQTYGVHKWLVLLEQPTFLTNKYNQI